MSAEVSNEYLVGVVQELRKLSRETEWVEFKENKADPVEIGEYISALSNSAALSGKPTGYLVWGIEDGSHEIVGTTFIPSRVRKGNEELENWLLRLLDPKVSFSFRELEIDGKRVVLLAVERAFRHPVRFQGEAFVRVQSYKKKIKDHPEREKELWRVFDDTPFEARLADEHLGADEVLKLLDYPSFFDLLGTPLPENRNGILAALEKDELIRADDGGTWSITNLGGILFAKQLSEFSRLRRKAIRVIEYKGVTRVETKKEQEGTKGYASGFEGLISYINNRLPSNEEIGQAFRKDVPVYPELAIRELVANALIHQDFFMFGTGPMVEIFEDRIEITNPGEPLIDTHRFLDNPPKSRNEALASMMRRIGICEERGSGVDKVVFQTELYQLPAPIFEKAEEHTRVCLLSPRPLTDMDKED